METKNYKYTLSRRAAVCPKCGRREFKYFTHPGTDTPVDISRFGRCNREKNCGYYLYPDVSATAPRPAAPPTPPAPRLTISDTAPDVYRRSLEGIMADPLINYLSGIFGPGAVWEAARAYRVGICPEAQSIVWWYISKAGKVIDGKVMRYEADGHRWKRRGPDGGVAWYHWEVIAEQPTPHPVRLSAPGTTWAQSLLRTIGRLPANSQAAPRELYGAHLLYNAPPDDERPVCIVESEKTALICSIYAPGPVWLATGGCKGLSGGMAAAPYLKPRRVVLLPDTGEADEWGGVARDLNSAGWSVSVLSLTAIVPGEWPANMDVADAIIATLTAKARPAAPVQADALTNPSPRLLEFIDKSPMLRNLIERFGLIEDNKAAI